MLWKIQKFNLVNELDSWYGTKERSFSEWPRDLDPHDTQLSLYKGDYSQFSSHLIHGNVYFENLIRPKVTLRVCPAIWSKVAKTHQTSNLY